MDKLTIIGVVVGLFLLSVIIGVYAHNQPPWGDDLNNEEYMESMHERVIESINDSELKEAMNKMHEGCEQFHRGNRYTMVRGHMMGY